MKTFAHTFLFSLILMTVSTQAQSIRTMSETERTQFKTQLDSVLKNNQDECYVNISNYNNIDVLSPSLLPQKNKGGSYIEQNTKNIYVRDRISSTLNLDITESLLPEGVITFSDATHFIVSYMRPVSVNVVEISYSEIQTPNFVQGMVYHTFEIKDGQPVWTQSTLDLADGENRKAHVRCKTKGGSGFDYVKSATKPVKAGAFIFLDLELAPAKEYCLVQCTEPLQGQSNQSQF